MRAMEVAYKQLDEGALKWTSSYGAFWSNMKLSMLVAFWVTAFGLFSFNPKLKTATFGHESCKSFDVGWVLDQASNATSVAEALPEHKTWCGVLPVSYHANWGNVVMMILFTVYLNTGTTIQLAWQGVIGTFMAVFNVWVMEVVFPEGGSTVWVWIDTLGFIFLMLLSGAAENTMKFGMNWHCWFMMSFMTTGPTQGTMPVRLFSWQIPGLEWDSYTTTSLLTSAMGALLAVVATLFPPPALTNHSKVAATASNIARAMRIIWGRSIDYFCGDQPGGEKYVIAQAVDNLNTEISKAIDDLRMSWWECFDLCGQFRKRRLYMAFDTAAKKMSALMVAVRDAVEHEDFQGSHRAFCGEMRARMMALQDVACNLLDCCHQACEDGDIDEREKGTMRALMEEVHSQQLEFLQVFNQVSEPERLSGASSVSVDLQNENTFAFALSVFAGKVHDLASSMMQLDDEADEMEKKPTCLDGFVASLKEGFWNTFRKPDKDKWIFAFRNWLTIAACYAIGYEMHCTDCVFKDRDANMAAMMSLLINHYSGSAFLNNVKRLLGVVIGKVLPVLIMGFVNPANNEGIFAVIDCAGNWGNLQMAVIVFVFTWFFTYMYYTSPNWGGIGCLAAGFGSAALIGPCGQTIDYAAYYKEIGQDVFAVFLCLSIDEVFDSIFGKKPRDAAVENVRAIQRDFSASLEQFFDNDFDEMEITLNKVMATIMDAQTFAFEADPALQMVGGRRAPFKIELYKDALAAFHLLHSDVSVLLLAVKEWSPDRLPRSGNDVSGWKGTTAQGNSPTSKDGQQLVTYLAGLASIEEVKAELLDTLELIVASLRNMLKHPSDDHNFQPASRTRRVLKLRADEGYRATDDLYREIQQKPVPLGKRTHVIHDNRARLTVIVKALENARSHLMHIERLLSRYIVLPASAAIEASDDETSSGSSSG